MSRTWQLPWRTVDYWTGQRSVNPFGVILCHYSVAIGVEEQAGPLEHHSSYIWHVVTLVWYWDHSTQQAGSLAYLQSTLTLMWNHCRCWFQPKNSRVRFAQPYRKIPSSSQSARLDSHLIQYWTDSFEHSDRPKTIVSPSCSWRVAWWAPRDWQSQVWSQSQHAENLWWRVQVRNPSVEAHTNQDRAVHFWWRLSRTRRFATSSPLLDSLTEAWVTLWWQVDSSHFLLAWVLYHLQMQSSYRDWNSVESAMRWDRQFLSWDSHHSDALPSYWTFVHWPLETVLWFHRCKCAQEAIQCRLGIDPSLRT